MKIIMQLVILTLLLTMVNAGDYCDHLIKECSQSFQKNCSYQNATITNCCDLKIFSTPSGVYKISKTTFDSASGYCDMTTDSRGWIVVQRNRKGSKINFNRFWLDYEKGFGDLKKEFWYGLDQLHCLTQIGQWEMRLDYQKSDWTWSYLHYNNFSVGNAKEEYPLTFGSFTGEIPDRFSSSSLNGRKFSSLNNDNDNSSINCASLHSSGWWYNKCHYSYNYVNININEQPPHIGFRNNILFTEMKIRPKSCLVP